MTNAQRVLGYDKFGKPIRLFDVVQIPCYNRGSRRNKAVVIKLQELTVPILDYGDGSVDLVTSIGFEHLRRV